jgi:hypothetical protein
MEAIAFQELTLQSGEESQAQLIIETITDRAHGGLDA